MSSKTLNPPQSSETIPQPPGIPLLGNTLQVGPKAILGIMEFAKDYHPVFRLNLPGGNPIFVSGFDLVNELCDESRFDKNITRPLRFVREIAGDGLFTAYTDEPNWRKAHHILTPAFSSAAMRNYFEMMLDIADQLVAKWEGLNTADDVNIPEDMTRLTLDTIALCGFGYRFNSFHQQEMHPFVDSMVRALQESMDRLARLPFQTHLMFAKQRQFKADQDYMNEVVDDVIRQRKANPDNFAGSKDLLSLMLTGADRETGERLDDLNIRHQAITFLIAGHETTSGLLSFATYFLLKHPAVLAKAYAEVDAVLGSDLTKRPTYDQINQLKYIKQILNESLRLWPTAPAFGVRAYEDTIIGGQYPIKTNDEITILVPMLHRDKVVWGENATLFDPENFSPEAVKARPANAFKPFGNGQRACIGRQFAMIEATLVLGMILQRFKLIDSSNYQLKIKQTLTIKPDDFKIKIRPRTEADRHQAATTPVVKPVASAPELTWTANYPLQHNTPLLILYGSNMGTAENLAYQTAGDAERYGYLSTVAPLDDYINKLPREGGVLIFSASYNGNPPDNAVAFCNWLSQLTAPDALKGVKYAIFGCGHRDWTATYQAVPKLIDTHLARAGAELLTERGEGDGGDDFFGDFQTWYKPLWATLATTFDLTEDVPDIAQAPLYNINIVNEAHPNPFVPTFNARPCQILVNRELQNKAAPNPSERSTRHIELALPAGVDYKTGDHLGVITHNPPTLVQRIAARFGFDERTVIILHQTSGGKTNFPLEKPIAVFDLLTDYVELQGVATQEHLKLLAKYTACLPEKEKLLVLTGDESSTKQRYRTEVLQKHKSIIDLLEEFPACELPFNIYLEQLPPLRPRYYSISSAPQHAEGRCSITVGVVDEPAWSGRGQYQGACSTYLATQVVDRTIYAFVHDTKSTFRLPTNPTLPLIMIGAGTGLAPFRGFLQERATLKAADQSVGESLLFFGCRHPEHDFIYADELAQFEAEGLTRVINAFSRLAEQKVYVQHQILDNQDIVWQFLEAGAIIYICGDASRMSPAVRQAFVTLYQNKTNCSPTEAETYIRNLEEQGRYLKDVWA